MKKLLTLIPLSAVLTSCGADELQDAQEKKQKYQIECFASVQDPSKTLETLTQVSVRSNKKYSNLENLIDDPETLEKTIQATKLECQQQGFTRIDTAICGNALRISKFLRLGYQHSEYTFNRQFRINWSCRDVEAENTK